MLTEFERQVETNRLRRKFSTGNPPSSSTGKPQPLSANAADEANAKFLFAHCSPKLHLSLDDARRIVRNQRYKASFPAAIQAALKAAMPAARLGGFCARPMMM